MNQLTPETIRARLEAVRSFHGAAVRSGDERLRAAMAEYARQVVPQDERDTAAA